jgi:hypothetical protein
MSIQPGQAAPDLEQDATDSAWKPPRPMRAGKPRSPNLRLADVPKE